MPMPTSINATSDAPQDENSKAPSAQQTVYDELILVPVDLTTAVGKPRGLIAPKAVLHSIGR